MNTCDFRSNNLLTSQNMNYKSSQETRQKPVLRRSTSTANCAELSSCNKLSSSERLLLNAAELCAAVDDADCVDDAACVLRNVGCERVMLLPAESDDAGHFIFCIS